MGEIINGKHDPEPVDKAHWCEYHCSRRFESEGMMCLDCDEFEEDEED